MKSNWTQHMLWVVHSALYEERRWGWNASPTITRLWRIETYLRKRVRRGHK